MQVADFGPQPIDADDVDQALIATIRTWVATYLWKTEDERGLGIGFFPRPVDENVRNALTSMTFLDSTLPAIIVTTARTPTAPERGADGVWRASWQSVVSSVVQGPDAAQTRFNASKFEGTLRRLILQQAARMPGTILSGVVKWDGTEVGPVPDATGEERWLAAGIGRYTVYTTDVVQDSVGPAVPNAEPYGTLPLVSDVTVDMGTLTDDEEQSQ